MIKVVIAQSTEDSAVHACNSVDIIGVDVITIQSMMYVVVADERRGMDDMSVATKLHRLPIGAAAADRWYKRAGFLWCSTANSPGNRPQNPKPEHGIRLEETDGLAHRALDVQRLDVLPVLLEQRNEEVDAWANE